MTTFYSHFLALQRDMRSSLIESPLMEYFRRPFEYSSERNTVVFTGSLSNEDTDGSEALLTMSRDNGSEPSLVVSSTVADANIEISITDEGHACCPLCLTAFGLSTQVAITRLSCGALFTVYQCLSTTLRTHTGHVAHYGCAVTLQYASDVPSCPTCLAPLDWGCLKTVFWTGVEDCRDPTR